jgi:hypothetical protein
MTGAEGNNTVLADPAKAYLGVDGPYSMSNASSHSGSEASLHRVKNLPGYTTPVFKGTHSLTVSFNFSEVLIDMSQVRRNSVLEFKRR